MEASTAHADDSDATPRTDARHVITAADHRVITKDAAKGADDQNESTAGNDRKNINVAIKGNVIYLVDKSGNILRRKLFRGMAQSPFPELEKNVENLHKLRIRPDDIIILAYESCGTHWVWEIVSMLVRGTSDYIDGIKEHLFLEMASIEAIEGSASPRVMNTHLYPSDITPETINGRCKMVFVTRNPKDALVSEYKHCTRTTITHYEGDFSDYFDLSMTKSPDYTFCSWISYTKAWETHFKLHPKLSALSVYYEDMKEDLGREVRAIADYLRLSVSDELINEIREKCTFKNMKMARSILHPDEGHMYRKGETGSWKEHFTVAMNERYDHEYKDQMADSPIAARIRFSL